MWIGPTVEVQGRMNRDDTVVRPHPGSDGVPADGLGIEQVRAAPEQTCNARAGGDALGVSVPWRAEHVGGQRPVEPAKTGRGAAEAADASYARVAQQGLQMRPSVPTLRARERRKEAAVYLQ